MMRIEKIDIYKGIEGYGTNSYFIPAPDRIVVTLEDGTVFEQDQISINVINQYNCLKISGDEIDERN